MAPLTPQITLTATLHDQNGNPVEKGQLIIALCGYGPTLPVIAGTSMYAKVGPVVYTLADGTTHSWTTQDGTSGMSGIPLWGNDVIVPAGTYYAISVVDAKKNVVQCGIYEFTGSGAIDLTNAQQISPGNPVTPPLNYMTEDMFGISNTVAAQQAASPDQIATVLNLNVNHPVPALLSPRSQSMLAPPGYIYTLTRSAQVPLMGLFYNGLLQLPSLHYTMTGRTVYLNFYTKNGDNLYALYVATSLS